MFIYGTVELLVKAAYPDRQWSSEKFALLGKRMTPQIYLQRIVRSLFPDAAIELNVRGKHGIKSAKGVPLEIDVFLPAYKLGFEYQVSQRGRKGRGRGRWVGEEGERERGRGNGRGVILEMLS